MTEQEQRDAEAKADYEAWLEALSPAERAAVEERGLGKFEPPSYSGKTQETWQTDLLRESKTDRDEVLTDLLQSGFTADQAAEALEIFELHAIELASEALHRLVLDWRESGVPRIHGLLHAMGMARMTIRESAQKCACAPSTVAGHKKQFRENRTLGT